MKTRSSGSVEVSQKELRRLEHRQLLRGVLIAVLVAATVLLMVDNREQVEVGWVLDETRAPLYQWLVGVWLSGAVVGLLASRRVSRRRGK